MVELLAVASEALNTTFALFARKLILSGEVIAVICTVGWRLEARLGIQLWPQRRLGLALLSDLVAAGSTIAVVLFVAFVRDYADIGSQQELMRYSGQCLTVLAAITILAAALDRFRNLSGCFELFATLVSTIVALVFLNRLVSAWSVPLDKIGAAFVQAGPERPFHGLAAILFAGLVVACVLRLLLARGRPLPVGTWDVFVVGALVALGQGFLAFRGVSALFILAAAGAGAWLAGWRAHVALRRGRVRVLFTRVSRAPAERVSELSALGLVLKPLGRSPDRSAVPLPELGGQNLRSRSL